MFQLTFARFSAKALHTVQKCALLSHPLRSQNERYGPFGRGQLTKWVVKGFFDSSFPVMHAPSGIWLPVSAALRLDLHRVAAAAHATYADADGDLAMPDSAAAVTSLLQQLRGTEKYLQASAVAGLLVWALPWAAQNVCARHSDRDLSLSITWLARCITAHYRSWSYRSYV